MSSQLLGSIILPMHTYGTPYMVIGLFPRPHPPIRLYKAALLTLAICSALRFYVAIVRSEREKSVHDSSIRSGDNERNTKHLCSDPLLLLLIHRCCRF